MALKCIIDYPPITHPIQITYQPYSHLALSITLTSTTSTILSPMKSLIVISRITALIPGQISMFVLLRKKLYLTESLQPKFKMVIFKLTWHFSKFKICYFLDWRVPRCNNFSYQNLVQLTRLICVAPLDSISFKYPPI